MTTSRLLEAYDAQLRTTSEMASATSWHREGPLFVGLYGPEGQPTRGHVSYAGLDGLQGDSLRTLVDRVVGFFRDETTVDTFEWKTRGHDGVPELDAILRSSGLEPEEAESVMVGRADALAAGARSLPDGARLRRVTEPDDIRAMCALQDHVFGRPMPGMADDLIARLAAGRGSELWVAEVHDSAGGDDGSGVGATDDGWFIVTAGRLEPVDGTEFAGIWGGATRADQRGRGLYRALTAARAESALRRGKTYVQSDSTDDSRPILERSGFECITTTTPYVWSRQA